MKPLLNSLGAPRGLAAALAALAVAIPLAGWAQSPSARTLPSYAQPNTHETIRGTIAGLSGAYGVSVDDDRGYVDNVLMHKGTIINPTGISLRVGMRVTVLGRPHGSSFDADRIDTPYHYVLRYPAYYPYGAYPYGYPYYAYPPYYGGNVWFGGYIRR